jgi:hypothetical protein
MSEESSFRAPRALGQPQPQPATAAASRVRRTEDPLAELARLIGQEDPFAEFVAQRPADPRAAGNLGIQRRTRPADGRGYDGRPTDRRPPPRTRESNFDDAVDHAPETPRSNGRGAYAYGGTRAPRADDATPALPRSPHDDAPVPAQSPANDRATDSRRERERPATRADARQARRATRQDDDPAFDSYAGPDYDPDYADDAYLPAHGDEFYDEAPRRRLRPWLLAGAAVIAVVVVSASGLFAYRAVFGVTNTGAPPVTIRPEAGPTKMVPGSTSKAADSGSNKQIYDRVGGESPQGNERMVSREERPIDASPSAFAPSRMPGGTVGAVTPAAPPPQAAPVTTSPSTASTEPRRVRTVTVRADGSVVGDQNRASATAQRAGNAPTSNGPLALSNAPGSSGAVAPPARPSQGDNPWASVTGGQTSAPTTQAALPQGNGANPAPIVAVNTPAPAGSYVVQVAAQKTEADAASTWQQLQQKYPAVLGSQQAAIRRVDLGERGVFYRAQVGPFGSRSQASEVCQSLKAAGGECVIQRN